jgi:hypothetical protein
MSDTDFHSFHAFLFPFEWKLKDHASGTLDEQTDLGEIKQLMGTGRAQWEAMPAWTQPATVVQYNEANYFYDFVRPVLYGGAEGNFLMYYKHKEAQGATYTITLHDGKAYKLHIESTSSGAGSTHRFCPLIMN